MKVASATTLSVQDPRIFATARPLSVAVAGESGEGSLSGCLTDGDPAGRWAE